MMQKKIVVPQQLNKKQQEPKQINRSASQQQSKIQLTNPKVALNQKVQQQQKIEVIKALPPKINNKQSQIEESKQQPMQGLFTQKPSAKLTDIKTIDPFSDKSKSKTNSFAYVYNAGGIPCRVNHGCSIMRLQWNPGVSVDSLSYDPLLITCFDGLIEEGHPYNFLAFNAIKEMLEDEGSSDKVIPLVSKLVWPLRTALTSKSDKVFEASLNVLKLFSNSVGSHINSQVKNLVVPLTKRMDNKKFRDKITDVLRSLEENGGPEAFKAIKSAIPTYSNM